MSEQSIKITQQDILEFIKKKSSVASPCNVCGASDWVLQDLHGIATTDKSGQVQLENLAGYAVVTCQSCGNSRFFSMRTIVAKLSSSA